MKKLSVLALVLLVSCSVGYAQKDDDQDRGSRSKSFTVSKGGLLEVSVGVGDIRISTWDKNEAYVHASGIDDDEIDRLKMTQSGNTVRVSFRPRGGWSHGSAEFEISIPKEFDTDLRTSGGDIEISDYIKGKIKGSTSGGDIKLSTVDGTVSMSTSGGNVHAGDIQGDGDLRTSGGDIKIGNVNGDLEISTSGGNIEVKSVGKTLQANTSGGDITIGDVGGEARVSTSGGNIDMGKVSGRATMHTSGGDVSLKGASGTVKASTSGGDMRLENVSGSIDASTSGGEIEAELYPSGTGRSKLSSSGGTVKLSIPASAKATIDATIHYGNSWGSWFGGRKDKYSVKSDFKADSYDKDEDAGEIHAVYTINGGGSEIELSTSGADIIIRKTGSK
ncbi:MAG TPA: hypothetical protein VMM37_10390 [Bacteroidota bacterium]|nr:hypothetical protein [Bacteroidota bacterium]